MPSPGSFRTDQAQARPSSPNFPAPAAVFSAAPSRSLDTSSPVVELPIRDKAESGSSLQKPNADPSARSIHVRVDAGHPVTHAATAIASSSRAPAPSNLATSDEHDGRSKQESWLHLHAVELIDRLQTWAADLDAREAHLNARASLLDQHERQMRLARQHAEFELHEIRQRIEQGTSELRAQARRLAFESE